MFESRTPRGVVTALLAVAAVAGTATAREVNVRVTIENLAPPNGGYLTPVWIGFHDGDFDLFDFGSAAPEMLERVAEDGNTAPLMTAFMDSGNGAAQATVPSDTGIPPLAPGETATMTFTLDGKDAKSRYFSYASMVIPSNDAFIANADPLAHPVFNHGGHFKGADFIIWGSGVRDAGTELNDENPTNTAFFGQAAPDTGQDENVGVHLHPGLMFPGSGGILDDAMFVNADFLADGYAVARITIARDDD